MSNTNLTVPGISRSTGLSTPGKMREANAAVRKEVLENGETVGKLKNYIQKKFGFDFMKESGADGKFPVRSRNWSWSKLENKLMESDASSSFPQFLRAGLQTITNAYYEATGTTFEDWVEVIPSSKDTEIYAPNHGVAFPRAVAAGGLFPEVGVAALDIQLQNQKFGDIYAIQEELLSDDQSGSFQRQASLMGEYMKVLEEVFCYGKLASVANMQYIQLLIPKSETKPSYETNYPWAPASGPLRGGGVTAATPGALNQAGIQAAFIGLMEQQNLQGIKMMIQPNRLIVSPLNRFQAAILLNSSFYPTGATAGAVGGAFSINPIQGIADLTISRYVFDNTGAIPGGGSKAWYLCEEHKGFIQQLREAVAVVQEATNSGESFDRQIVRFRASSRFNADFIDPRFFWQGNDGSV